MCPLDYLRYTKGEVVKCTECGMLRAKKGDCVRCSESMGSFDVALKRDEIRYWGTKLFAIAKGGKEQGGDDYDMYRYERVMKVSREFMPFWEDASKIVVAITKKQMISWSDELHDIAEKGLDDSPETSRYSDILRISDEIEQETESYFEEPGSISERRHAVDDVEFVYDRDISPRLVQMLERAEKLILIASPWVGAIKEIIETLEEVRTDQNVHVKIIVRPPESDDDYSHRETLRELGRRGFHVEMEERLHAKMIVVDDKELYIGSANLTPRSMDKNLEVGICTTNPEVVSKAAMYFEQVFQEAFDKRLDSKV